MRYCIKCFGIEPCWCDKHEYIETWEFVYWAMRRTKGG